LPPLLRHCLARAIHLRGRIGHRFVPLAERGLRDNLNRGHCTLPRNTPLPARRAVTHPGQPGGAWLPPFRSVEALRVRGGLDGPALAVPALGQRHLVAGDGVVEPADSRTAARRAARDTVKLAAAGAGGGYGLDAPARAVPGRR